MLRQRYGWMVHISGCLVLHEIGLIALIHPHFIRLLWDLQTVQNVQGCAWSKHGMGESSFCVKNCQKVTLMQIFGRESHLKTEKLPNFSHLMFFGFVYFCRQKSHCRHESVDTFTDPVQKRPVKLKSVWGGSRTLFLHHQIENKNTSVEAF